MKDHEISNLVNDIIDIAEMYAGSGQLRERISSRINYAFRSIEPTPLYIRNPSLDRMAKKGGMCCKVQISYKQADFEHDVVTRALTGTYLSDHYTTEEHSCFEDERGNVNFYDFKHTILALLDLTEADLGSA